MEFEFKEYSEFSHYERIHIEKIEDAFNGVFVRSLFPGPWVQDWEKYNDCITFDTIINKESVYGNVDGFEETTYTHRVYVDNYACIVDFCYAECKDEEAYTGYEGGRRLRPSYKEKKRIIITYSPELFMEIKARKGLKEIMKEVPSYEFVIDNLRLNGELPWPEEKPLETLWGSDAPRGTRYEIVLDGDNLVLHLIGPEEKDSELAEVLFFDEDEIEEDQEVFREIVDEIPL